MNKLVQNWQAPLPPFFRLLRNIGLVLTGVTTAILTAPVTLPAAITTIAGYLAVAGSVAATISQLTTDSNNTKGGEDDTGLSK